MIRGTALQGSRASHSLSGGVRREQADTVGEKIAEKNVDNYRRSYDIVPLCCNLRSPIREVRPYGRLEGWACGVKDDNTGGGT